MKTYLPKPLEIPRKWHVVDAKDAVLGRLAAKVANVLRGKDKPVYTSNVDTGDFVVVINAAQVKLTGKKDDQKTYMSYSGWRGGERYRTVTEVRATHPERIIEHAVKGMLPKNRIGRQMFGKLKVYPGAEHPHTAQQPQPLAAI
jgi:large subunit ribosomal protein L13